MEYMVKAEIKRGLVVTFEIVAKAVSDEDGVIIVTPYRVDIPLSNMMLIPKEFESCGN